MPTTAAEAWFLDSRVRFHVLHEGSADGISVIESVAPRGDSPPLHVHRTEDELFLVLEGALTLAIDGAHVRVSAGESALAPKGVPHTYRVETPTARWHVVTTRGDFEAFVRAACREAGDGLPEPAGPPAAEAAAAFAALAAEHGIELVGPPL
jgi:quercetin dioxygenase-like cupin family protein